MKYPLDNENKKKKIGLYIMNLYDRSRSILQYAIS